MKRITGLLGLVPLLLVLTVQAAGLSYEEIQKGQGELEGMMLSTGYSAQCRIFWDENDKAHRIVVRQSDPRSGDWPAYFFVNAVFVIGKYTAKTTWKSSSATLIATPAKDSTVSRVIATTHCRRAMKLLTAAGKEVSQDYERQVAWDDCLSQAMTFAAEHIAEPFNDPKLIELIRDNEPRQLKAAEFLAKHLKRP